ncbi:uncharacterized protein N0V89_011578 [Didymosphaeria variabile]|uniref:Uncharacterized protein n=1 Tax=Didymosphaeria variabile TaxID=1932322 RepID=A0A9W8XBY6_9PLEO|nr:uncharacterized protein N0V89_011578 [Didymosphaeria variabile]KAJ4345447.1 hypothetical protein N0V89_011578 [Didymosphaeria variabile]
MSQPTLFDNWNDGSNGWSDNPEAEDRTISGPEIVRRSYWYNIICGIQIEKSRAQHMLQYLQFMFGEMSSSLDAINEHKLTKPLPVADSNKFFNLGHDYENGRVRSAIADLSTDSTLRAMIMAKKSVASGHVMLHESFLVERPMVPASFACSLWKRLLDVPESCDFRNCRNFFSHAFLRTDFGNDLKDYCKIKQMYTDHLPILEVLIKKLQAGLEDESAWKNDELELSYSNRPAYAFDIPEGEAEAEEQRQVKASARNLSSPTSLDLPDCNAYDRTPKHWASSHFTIKTHDSEPLPPIQTIYSLRHPYFRPDQSKPDMSSNGPDDNTPYPSEGWASGSKNQEIAAQDRESGTLVHPMTLVESQSIQNQNLDDDHDALNDRESSNPDNSGSRKSLGERNALNQNHASESKDHSPNAWNGALARFKDSLSRFRANSLDQRSVSNRKRTSISRGTWNDALTRATKRLFHLKGKSTHVSRSNSFRSHQVSDPSLYNMVCRAFIKYQNAKKLSISLGAWHNDLVESCALIERGHKLTKPHPRAPAGRSNAFNQILMASDDPQDREFVLRKHTVASVLISMVERWSNDEQAYFPKSAYAHSLWDIISSPENGLSSKSMTEARNWFARALRNEEAESGNLGDHIMFNRILKVYKRILPAVKATRDKINEALGDTGAWVPDPYQVSDRPNYTKECPKGEDSRRIRLVTTKRNPEVTDRQLELHWAALGTNPGAPPLLPGARVGWGDTPEESIERTTSRQSLEEEGRTYSLAQEDGERTAWPTEEDEGTTSGHPQPNYYDTEDWPVTPRDP